MQSNLGCRAPRHIGFQMVSVSFVPFTESIQFFRIPVLLLTLRWAYVRSQALEASQDETGRCRKKHQKSSKHQKDQIPRPVKAIAWYSPKLCFAETSEIGRSDPDTGDSSTRIGPGLQLLSADRMTNIATCYMLQHVATVKSVKSQLHFIGRTAKCLAASTAALPRFALSLHTGAWI